MCICFFTPYTFPLRMALGNIYFSLCQLKKCQSLTFSNRLLAFVILKYIFVRVGHACLICKISPFLSFMCLWIYFAWPNGANSPRVQMTSTDRVQMAYIS
jgi:hypothetical protein